MQTAVLGAQYDGDALEHKVQVLKALAHPVRLGMVVLLARGSANVGELSATLDVPQAVVSQQLRFLRMAGLVAAERRDGFAVYRIREPLLHDMVGCIGRCGVPGAARARKGARS